MNRLKKFFAVTAIALTLGVSLSSCHRDGCPNNFKLSDVHEVVQTILQ